MTYQECLWLVACDTENFNDELAWKLVETGKTQAAMKLANECSIYAEAVWSTEFIGSSLWLRGEPVARVNEVMSVSESRNRCNQANRMVSLCFAAERLMLTKLQSVATQQGN